LAGVSAVSAGGYFTVALKSDGSLWAWGQNSHGELGDGTTTDRHTPVDVSGLTSGVAVTGAGGSHTCAVTTTGGLKCWGFNSNGQLGDGTTTRRLTPVSVSGLSSGAAAVAGGAYHTCALTTAGGAKCWGRNANGQLGDGTTTDRLTPVNVSGLTSGVVAVATGGFHSCALTGAGAVKCWGRNSEGQLGDGTTADRATPVGVSGLGSGVVALDAGLYHTCALTNVGVVKCWGDNSYGQLGDGTTTNRLTPIDVPGIYGPDTIPPTISGSAAPPANGSGWNNTPVTVSFTCSDAESGIASCPSPTVLSGEGANQNVTGTATDNAGNSASATVGPINIDLSGPSITGVASPPPNGAGWNNSDVSVHWVCFDPLSGIDGACPADSLITGEGAGLSASASVSDKAGNPATGSVSVDIDRTAPMTTATAPSGWNNMSVTVALNAFDNLSGIGATHFVLDGGAEQTGSSLSIDSEGDHVLEYWSVDVAGNEEAHHEVHVLIDETSPSITHTQAPPPNGNGWNDSSVTVTFTCTDDRSGIASCTDPVTLADEGLSQAVTGTAVDNAGNTATDVASVSIDETDPSISGAATSSPNGAGWYGAPVTVAFTCADALSGIASCPASSILSSDGANKSVSGTAIDAADNSASATVTGINIDQAAPSAIITAPADGASYTVGQVVAAAYACSDSLSGIDSCSGTVPSGTSIDTLTAGTKSFAVTAVDRAGNVTTATVSYSVAAPSSQATTTTVSSSINPSVLNGSVTFTASVTAAAGTPTGTVQWKIDGVNSGSPVALDANGQAALTTSALSLTSATPHVISAVYSGGPGFDPSTGTISQSVAYATGGNVLGSPGHQILQPINADGTSVFKAKSTVVAKFRVGDANGVSIGTPGVVTSFRLTQTISGTVVSYVDEAVSSATPDTAFRWDPSAQQWIYNISTKGMAAGYTYVYTITLNDGSTIQFQFGLRN
jgi:hypothetical protein